VTGVNDEIIAERKLYLDGEPGTEPAAIVRLFRPHDVEGDYPRCRYELISKTGVQGNEVSGLDGLDCIVSCLAVVGTIIAGVNESVYGGRLRWEGSPGGGRGLGLPTIEEHWPEYREALEWAVNQQPPDRRQD
jgi:hypothetical protein